MATHMIFLELSKYCKNHMIPPMIFDGTIQQFNIFAWYSPKNIQINLMPLYTPPDFYQNFKENFQNLEKFWKMISKR